MFTKLPEKLKCFNCQQGEQWILKGAVNAPPQRYQKRLMELW